MEPNNNIDKVFREGFSGLEVDPGVEGWSALEKRLAVNDRRQRMFVWRWTSLAAMLVVVFSAGYLWYHADRQMIPPGNENRTIEPGPAQTRDDQEIKDLDHRMTPFAVQKNEVNTNEAPSSKAIGANNSLHEGPGTISKQGSETMLPMVKTAREAYGSPAIQSPITLNSTWPGHRELPMLPDSILKSTGTLNTVSPRAGLQEVPAFPAYVSIYPSRWSLGIYISPSIGFSGVDIKDNEDVAVINASNDRVSPSLTAGLEVEYRTKGRWAFAVGLFASQWLQHNDRLVATTHPGSPTTSSNSIFSNNSTANLRFEDGEDGNRESFANTGDGLLLVPELEETYNFLEAPISASYYILERGPWSWKLRGGLSTRFLTSSSVELLYEDGRKQNVDNLPLKSFSIQLLVGSGFEYRLNTKLRLHLMPSVQYGLTPVNQHKVVDTYLHQFLIYGGLSYEL